MTRVEERVGEPTAGRGRCSPGRRFADGSTKLPVARPAGRPAQAPAPERTKSHRLPKRPTGLGKGGVFVEYVVAGQRAVSTKREALSHPRLSLLAPGQIRHWIPPQIPPPGRDGNGTPGVARPPWRFPEGSGKRPACSQVGPGRSRPDHRHGRDRVGTRGPRKVAVESRRLLHAVGSATRRSTRRSRLRLQGRVASSRWIARSKGVLSSQVAGSTEAIDVPKTKWVMASAVRRSAG